MTRAGGINDVRVGHEGESVALVMDPLAADLVIELLQKHYIEQAGQAAVGAMPTVFDDKARRDLIVDYGQAVRWLESLRGIVMGRVYRARKKAKEA